MQTRAAKITQWATRKTEEVGIPPSFFVHSVFCISCTSQSHFWPNCLAVLHSLSALHRTGKCLQSAAQGPYYTHLYLCIYLSSRECIVKTLSWPGCKDQSSSR